MYGTIYAEIVEGSVDLHLLDYLNQMYSVNKWVA